MDLEETAVLSSFLSLFFGAIATGQTNTDDTPVRIILEDLLNIKRFMGSKKVPNAKMHDPRFDPVDVIGRSLHTDGKRLEDFVRNHGFLRS